MITFIGFTLMLSIIVLILLRRITPIVAFTTLPVAASLSAGFSVEQTGTFIKSGLATVAPTATLFIFAILYFGVMRDRGLFHPLVNFLIRMTRGRPIPVALMTVATTALVHLDGIGAATFLLIIPALLPVYQRLNMNPLMLLCLVGTTAGVSNMVPWGGTTTRAAAVTGFDATQLWLALVPVQAIGLLCLFAIAGWLGYRCQRGAQAMAKPPTELPDASVQGLTETHALSPRCWRYWANLGLTLTIVGCLFAGLLPLQATFMIGLGIALPLNFPSLTQQSERLKAHAGDAMHMALVILAAGVLLGILSGTRMSEGMAMALNGLMPVDSGQYLHVAIGALGVPLGMLFSPDAYYFALLPVINEVAVASGVSADSVARAMLIGENTGFIVSPMVPSVYLAVALAGMELRAHIRYTFFWAWAVSLVMLAFAVFIGVIGFSQ
ncbi:CitMHS family transporter [Pseudomonas trivialis]|uniref:Citrate transporter n=1 Tax=Pseudomonas trivialis TaxID=200450 RepID=A0A0R2ZK09_9PSED|nr:citrate:proton symporter [Pseudomonas trivialis]KRP61286.1 citrate transporter [Pseudomonas trivialis]SDT01561.1 citrate-Mg2+:H+ or citrate-Ca2+:H+ symporter, CitMHS family [Pseudomonas trivialis]